MSEVMYRLRHENNQMHDAIVRCNNEKKILNEEIKDLRLKIVTLLFWLITEWAIIVLILLNR